MHRPAEVIKLQHLYEIEAQRFASAQNQTGMNCPPTCGKCCQVPTVEASPFEMLPMAYTLLEKGKAEAVLEKIKNQETDLCPLFEPHPTRPGEGRCGEYQDRPLVCRTFAVSSRLNKYQQAELLLCRELKLLYPNEAQEYQNLAQDLPSISEAFNQLVNIDPRSQHEQQRISLALGVALEKVLYLSQLGKS
jgi:Fe-S-cluster containining protein